MKIQVFGSSVVALENLWRSQRTENWHEDVIRIIRLLENRQMAINSIYCTSTPLLCSCPCLWNASIEFRYHLVPRCKSFFIDFLGMFGPLWPMNVPPQRKEAAALAEKLLRLQWGCLKSLKLFVPRRKVFPLPDTCRPDFFFVRGWRGQSDVHLCMKRVLDVGKVVPLIWATSYE